MIRNLARESRSRLILGLPDRFTYFLTDQKSLELAIHLTHIINGLDLLFVRSPDCGPDRPTLVALFAGKYPLDKSQSGINEAAIEALNTCVFRVCIRVLA